MAILLIMLVATAWLLDAIAPDFSDLLASGYGSSEEQMLEGRTMAGQLLGLSFLGSVMLASWLAGKRVAPCSAAVKCAWFAGALLIVGLICLESGVENILLPDLFSSKPWVTFPLFFGSLATGYAYGTGYMRDAPRSAETAAGAGASAAGGVEPAVKHKADIADFFH